MTNRQVIASIILLIGIGLMCYVAFGDPTSEGGSMAKYLAGAPCSLFLMVVGVALFQLSEKRPKTKFRVLCPDCNYDMTGLSQTKCPECGAEFTIDQLKIK